MNNSVALGIPIMDSVPGEGYGTHLSVAVELARVTAEVKIITALNLHPHDRARQFIVDRALEAGCRYLLFVDDDMIVSPGSTMRAFETMMANDCQVVSGHYYRRGYPYTCVWSKQVLTDGKHEYMQVHASQGVHRIDVSGLGFALIDLSWVKKHLSRPYFIMDTVTEAGLSVTDDTSFFEKIKAAGGTVLGDAQIRCGHLGQRELISDATVEDLRRYNIRG